MIKIDLKKYKAFLFDMDGTLVNSEPVHYQSAVKTMADYGKDYVSFDEHKKIYTGTGVTNVFTKEAEKHGLEVNVEELKEKFHDHLEGVINQKGIPPMEGILKFLEKSKQSRIKLAIVSGSMEPLVRHTLKKSNLPDIFEQIVTIEKYQKPKPDPACYLMAAQLLGVKPEDCLVFEDAPSGIQSALNAGMDVIVVGETITQNQIDTINPDLQHVKDFTEISLI